MGAGSVSRNRNGMGGGIVIRGPMGAVRMVERDGNLGGVLLLLGWGLMLQGRNRQSMRGMEGGAENRAPVRRM